MTSDETLDRPWWEAIKRGLRMGRPLTTLETRALIAFVDRALGTDGQAGALCQGCGDLQDELDGAESRAETLARALKRIATREPARPLGGCRCYEVAKDALGIPRNAPVPSTPTPTGTPAPAVAASYSVSVVVPGCAADGSLCRSPIACSGRGYCIANKTKAAEHAAAKSEDHPDRESYSADDFTAAGAPTKQEDPPVCGLRDHHSPRVCDRPAGHDGAHDDSRLPTGAVHFADCAHQDGHRGPCTPPPAPDEPQRGNR